jgi:hypothetical protein
MDVLVMDRLPPWRWTFAGAYAYLLAFGAQAEKKSSLTV